MSSAGEPKSYARNATAGRRKQSALPSPLLKRKSARQQRVGQLGLGSHSSLRDGQAECLAIAAPREDAFLMADNSEEARARAEARFNRQQQRSRRDDDRKAGIAAQARAVDKKTARLKELRLAKAAVDEDGKPAEPDGGHAPEVKRKLPPLVADPDEVKGG
jgi:hypothetical protein